MDGLKKIKIVIDLKKRMIEIINIIYKHTINNYH